MTQRTVIGSRQCTGDGCEHIIPVYESKGHGNGQPKFCPICLRAKRLATNNRVGKEQRSELAAPADVRDPIFRVSGGHFQGDPPEKILRNWAEWRRDHGRVMV